MGNGEIHSVWTIWLNNEALLNGDPRRNVLANLFDKTTDILESRPNKARVIKKELIRE